MYKIQMQLKSMEKNVIANRTTKKHSVQTLHLVNALHLVNDHLTEILDRKSVV